MQTGIVTFFNEIDGFGFIKEDKTNESIFVHWKSLEFDDNREKTLHKNDKVKFTKIRTTKGWQTETCFLINN